MPRGREKSCRCAGSGEGSTEGIEETGRRLCGQRAEALGKLMWAELSSRWTYTSQGRKGQFIELDLYVRGVEGQLYRKNETGKDWYLKRGGHGAT